MIREWLRLLAEQGVDPQTLIFGSSKILDLKLTDFVAKIRHSLKKKAKNTIFHMK